MSAITTARAALFALLDEARIYDLDMHTSPAFQKLQFGATLRAVLDVLATLDSSYDSISGTPPNYGPSAATINALKAIGINDRKDQQVRLVKSNELGGESIYVFHSTSTATNDNVNVLAPTAGNGRWLLLAKQGQPALVANARAYLASSFAGVALNSAATFTNYMHVADVAETVTMCKVVCTGTPSTQPTAGNAVTVSVKKGATVVATKVYEVNMPAAGTWDALDLSSTPANLDLAAGDALTFEVIQAGTARLGTASGIVLQVATKPAAA